MKHFFAIMVLCSSIFANCSTSNGISNIQPKSGRIEIPANGEVRMWRDVRHSGFILAVTNPSPGQSVELYTVRSDGSEKWVSPSLIANTSLNVTIPADGHLLIKNFNENIFTITYKIIE
ncbi:MAG: hypothetical protein JNJ75_00580 [Cyclobacteriaceae bacterium]|nr:hypothetical protein [Cyclobacteriaceae bacterium]